MTYRGKTLNLMPLSPYLVYIWHIVVNFYSCLFLFSKDGSILSYLSWRFINTWLFLISILMYLTRRGNYNVLDPTHCTTCIRHRSLYRLLNYGSNPFVCFTNYLVNYLLQNGFLMSLIFLESFRPRFFFVRFQN